MNLSDIVDKCSLEALVTIFFNFKYNNIDKKIFIDSKYTKSKFSTIDLTTDVILKNNELLSNWTGLEFEVINCKYGYHKYEIDFDNCNIDNFIKKIYKSIQKQREFYSDTEFEQILILGLFGLRGSLDLKANYYSVDISRSIQTEYYLDCIFKLLTNISDYRQLNLNFRELQKEYAYDNKKRNTQIRINLKYFFEVIAENLKLINIYKNNILISNLTNIKNLSIKYSGESFIERLTIYKYKILNKINNLNDEKYKNNLILELRKELGFITSDIEKNKRNKSVVDIARIIYEDECVCCKDKYSLEQRTFKMRKNNKYYLEIHHVVSFASDKLGDQIDNLVKICPSCHKALTKDRAFEDYQKELISNILKNSKSAYSYVENFFDDPTLDKMITYVYERLK